ncbi:MAG: protease pro-enzyme activation domain-containing protein [Polyangiaceae bacterium]
MFERSRAWALRSLLFSGVGAIVGCSSGQAPTGTSSQASAGVATAMAIPSWAKTSSFAGRLDEATPLQIQVHLRLHNQAAAQAELADISNPDSPRYAQFLSDADFATKYAPTASDVATVRAHFEGHGLTVTAIPANNAYITLNGTAGQMEQAFSTQLGQYRVGTETRRAPMTAATLPATVGASVLAVLGLATPSKAKSQRLPLSALHSANPADSTQEDPCSLYYGQLLDTQDPPFGGGFPSPMPYAGCGYKPAQLRQGYGFDTLVREGNDGTGQKIAIVDAWTPPTLVQDAQTYFATEDADYPLATSQITLYQGPGTAQPPDTGWYGESTLDVETVHAMAPGANIAYVGAQSDDDTDLIAAINMIVTKHLATLVSNSYSEIELGDDDYAPWESIAIQAGLKGIGLYFATGDSGDFSEYTGGTPTIGFPSSLAEVTAVGGTSLALGRSNNVLFQLGWETAVSFLTIPTLEDGGAEADAGPGTWQPAPPGDWYFGAGGGVSIVYLQPSWQVGIVPASLSTYMNATDRVIPDVSMLADPMTGYLVGESDGNGNYSEQVIGGTSLATPMFTATMALAQQSTGKKFGSANAALYKASKKGAFSDIAPGAPEAVAVPEVATTFDYHGPENSNATAAGFDTVTGLGVPNGKKFFTALK